jgi:tetratricopeptide (TPR) repeat protein
MFKKIKLLLIIIIFSNCTNTIFAVENFFEKGQQKYEEKKFEDSKFLFQRSIVFEPKHAKSYLYLAKIYNLEENEKEEEKNINTVLLLEPKNEEAIYMLIKIQLKKSNYLKVKELSKTFIKNCKNLCEKNKSILESLKNLEPKNES